MSLILIIDDVPAMCEQYAYDLQRMADHKTLTASSGAKGLAAIESEPIDCVILDLEMPGMDGFEVLQTLAKRGHPVPIIVYTATGDFDRCVRAVNLGAYCFIDKAEPMERIVQEIENALENQRLTSEVRVLKDRLGEDSPIIGDSRPMQELKDTIARLAPIPSVILITGESGCGKELVAKELHRLGGRARELFLPLNCAALPEQLVESELFGHEAGAFTGAHQMRKGAFEAASKGTLFLDEVGELSPPVQAKLLRVLEEQKVTRVGGTRQIPVETRVVAATNRSLETEIAAGRFRQDLYFRLNVHVLPVPPLRERLADVPALFEFFLTSTCERFGLRIKSCTREVVRLLQAYPWEKNNVRELRNIVERMVIACDGSEIQVGHVPAEIRQPGTAGKTPGAGAAATPGAAGTLREAKAAAERLIILTALNQNEWQITKTAAALGLADHSSLLKIMRRHGLKR